MRYIDELYSDFFNRSWLLNETYSSTIAFGFINSCALGLPLNLIVVYLSFFSGHVKGEFKYFFGNLAILDILYCLTLFSAWLIQELFISNNWESNVIWCTIQVHPPFVFAMASAMAAPLISINRYFVIVHDSTWFTVKHIAILCLYPYSIVLVWLLFDLLYAPYVSVFVRCGYILYTPFIPEVFFVPIVLGYFAVIFCNWKIYRFIWGHINRTETLMGRNVCDYKGEKTILKAMIIQAIIPVVCATPACVYFVYFTMYGRSAADLVPLAIGNIRPTIEDYALNTYTCSPYCNAIATLFIIKQYRKALHAFYRRLKYVLWLCVKCGNANHAGKTLFTRSNLRMRK